jgi:regulator of cell morphogenesis and NO signaling
MSGHVVHTKSVGGTPMSDRTVGELVAEQPGRSRVFQDLGLDFCCQGSRTLREACERKGIRLEEVVERLGGEGTEKADAVNAESLPPSALIDYIITVHHEFLREELPRLHGMAQRVAHVHGGHTPSLREVLVVFESLFVELDSHMAKEEQILFPAIRVMAGGSGVAFPLDGPIACMMQEHADADAAVEKLRALTGGFQPPAEACNTYRALFAGLADLDRDLHRHIFLENEVLFPAAARLAGKPHEVMGYGKA